MRRPVTDEERFATVTYSVADHVARIMMNRPEKRNAENVQLIEERDAAFRIAEADPDVRVIILGGSGPSFSAGHDLAEIATDERMHHIRSDLDSTVEFEWRYYFETSLRIQALSKPTIAMVQGACVAGGFVAAAMCDLIVASDDARFRDPVLGFGQRQDAAGTALSSASMEVFFHPWQLGVRKSKELLFTGEWMDAQDAKECGFVNRVVPPDQLEAETLALAHRITEASPAAVALVKRSFQFAQDEMGMGRSLQHHFMLHQLRHAGLSEAWLRPRDLAWGGLRPAADARTDGELASVLPHHE